jgi:peptide chain release factor 2
MAKHSKPVKYNIILHPKDLRRDTMRAGGPGGQHQNKTESAVRYTHVPTGISAESRSERSQHANDEYALEMLKDKILRLFLIRRGESVKDAWRQKPDPSFGSKMRSYVLAGSARRVVDHGSGWKGDPRNVLEGHIDDLLNARLRMPDILDPEFATAVD